MQIQRKSGWNTQTNVCSYTSPRTSWIKNCLTFTLTFGTERRAESITWSLSTTEVIEIKHRRFWIYNNIVRGCAEAFFCSRKSLTEKVGTFQVGVVTFLEEETDGSHRPQVLQKYHLYTVLTDGMSSAEREPLPHSKRPGRTFPSKEGMKGT